MSEISVPEQEQPKKTRGRPKKQSTEVAAIESVAPPAELTDTGAIIRAITQLSRDPALNVANMQYLLETRRALMLEEAEQGYNDAMARCQARIAPIAKDCENPQTRSRYASYHALDRAVRPAYTEEGFSFSFDTAEAPNPNDILVLLDVTHGRFRKRFSIPMPCDGKGPRGNDVMSRTHAVGSAVSYGRRYLLCCALNIVTGDDDGNRAGARAPVGPRIEPPFDRPEPKRRPPPPPRPDNFVPAPPPPDPEDRAKHTRQAIEAATTRARAGLMKSLEGSVTECNEQQLAQLRKAMFAAAVSERVVTEAFEVAELSQLTPAQCLQAIERCEEKERRMKEGARSDGGE